MSSRPTPPFANIGPRCGNCGRCAVCRARGRRPRAGGGRRPRAGGRRRRQTLQPHVDNVMDLLRAMDTNQDGVIDREEFEAAQQELGDDGEE